jgi:anti-sigma regulatory factor (Ser/Thr protein kinase)
VFLEPNAAQTLAVVCHELVTNATKYGALSVASGRVVIAWTSTSDGRLVLRWTETGGPRSHGDQTLWPRDVSHCGDRIGRLGGKAHGQIITDRGLNSG